MTLTRQIVLAGGNGYIGCATAFALSEAGFQPIILDDYSTSKSGAQTHFDVIPVDLTQLAETRKVFGSLGPVAGIIHFAARALVPESFREPSLYFRNNMLCTLHLAEVASEFNIKTIIHSSSCAVYGVPTSVPIKESSSYQPASPYGDSKVIAEMILNRYHQMGKFRALNLRYFNPAGAWPEYSWGEAHEPETHLLPNVLLAALTGRPVSVYGNDYNTPDGTCIRDFIHVVDLAHAHIKAWETLDANKSLPQSLNVGTGLGVSVLEVIRAAEKVTGRTIAIDFQPRRPGDPPHLVADPQQLKKYLGWKPERSLSQMLRDDWTWRTSAIK
ncbi:MAG: UDP-glucose 4-epimerase GalE [Proteobacteria bacterium]|nr:UDP-glucose 4-epimerase GalE [Pseudomonadota bacterium]NDC25126.1 UDP-glucose 4-epimerase GalE [Pseudomonadota bacterium]NDD04970.1 UDP-glucose 4-epimerase GalE [Pseudomonadota bacterium]NDG27821.1 UDP-glucose 4-epimerase GalE [Pseudomonadota bacterium]